MCCEQALTVDLYRPSAFMRCNSLVPLSAFKTRKIAETRRHMQHAYFPLRTAHCLCKGNENWGLVVAVSNACRCRLLSARLFRVA